MGLCSGMPNPSGLDCKLNHNRQQPTARSKILGTHPAGQNPRNISSRDCTNTGASTLPAKRSDSGPASVKQHKLLSMAWPLHCIHLYRGIHALWQVMVQNDCIAIGWSHAPLCASAYLCVKKYGVSIGWFRPHESRRGCV